MTFALPKTALILAAILALIAAIALTGGGL